MKKFLSLLLIVLMVFSITGCGTESQYKKGAKALDNGKYKVAREIFADMPREYKDSAEKYRISGFYMFMDYVKEKSLLSATGDDGKMNFVVNVTEDDKLALEYSYNVGEYSMGYSMKLEISPDSNMADLSIESEYSYLFLSEKESGKGQVDIASYKAGYKIELAEYNITGNPLNGQYSALAKTALDNQFDVLPKMLKKFLDESGLGVTIDEIGFKNFVE